VSDNGTLVYIGGSDFHRRLVAVERNGFAKALLPDLRRYYTPRVSPDGKHIAVEVGVMDGWDVWDYDVASRTFAPLTRDGMSVRPGAWTPDGSTVSLLRLVESTDGSGRTRPLTPWLGSVADVSFGGKTVAVMTATGQIEMPGVDSSTPRVIVPRSARPAVMRLSGDGQVIAYEARTSDPIEVVARSVSGGSQIQVSSGGGSEPLWSRAGDQLFYRGGSFLIAATISRNPLRVIRRDTLFRDPFMRGAIATNYDVLPDGKFVMIQNENPDVHPTVVVNWLRKRP
jgi:Tol biopolymer transport system component